jgi:hypothetical protein
MRQANAERLSNQPEVPECDISLASLDTSYVGSIETTFRCKPFLRQALGLSKLANLRSEAFQNVV